MKRNARGSAFVLVLFVLLVLNIVFLSLVNENRRDKPGAHRFLHDTQAFYLAQAGFQVAVRDIRATFRVATATATDTGTDLAAPASTATVTTAPFQISASTGLFTGSIGSEKIKLELGNYSYRLDVIPLPDERVHYFIHARGEVTAAGERVLAKRIITAVYEQGPNIPLHLVYWKMPDFQLRDPRYLPPPDAR